MTSTSAFQVNYCFFCFKANDPKSSSSSKLLSSLFFKNIQRLYGGNPKLEQLIQRHVNDNNFCNLVEGVCSDCAYLITKANALTSEISVLQLRLQWEYKKLHQIMRLAGKVPGRVKEYKDYLEKEFGEDVNERDLLTLAQDVSDFRKNVTGLLKKVAKANNPRVCIKRVACFIKQEQMESRCDNYCDDDDSPDANEEALNTGDDGCSFATDIQEDEPIERKVDCPVIQEDNHNVNGGIDSTNKEVLIEEGAPVTPPKICNQEDDFGGKAMESVPTPVNETTKPSKSKERGIRNKICPFEGCKERFILDAELEVHLRLHGNFPCKFCDKSFTRVERLVDHELQTHSHPSGTGVKCARCKRILILNPKNPYTKVRHYMDLHLGISSYAEGNVKCPICGRRFIPSRFNTKRLRVHIEAEHSIEGKDEKSIFRCEKCNAPFLTDLQKLQHLRKEHNTAKWYCSACDLAFTSNHTYKTHQRKAHGSFEYMCTVPGCGIMLPSKPRLDLHLRGNKGHKGRMEMLKCPQCDKLFLNEIHLKRHVICPKKRKVHVHREVCEKCGKVFKGLKRVPTQHRLKVHLESRLEDYSANWQFACEICGKKCKNTFYLEQHKRTHSKSKPFLCSHCGRGFSIQYNMKRHIKLVHKILVIGERKRRDYDSIQDDDAS